MLLVYSGQSRPSAMKIVEASEGRITAVRWSPSGVFDVNWGCRKANADINPNTSNTVNKRLMRELFKQHDVPIPHLLTQADLTSWCNGQSRGRLVGRPDMHTRGRGFWLIENETDLDKALKGTRKKSAATHFMEYIDAPHELRVHIYKGKSIRISEKAHTAFHEYTTIKPRCPVKQARKAAKQAVEALGMDFGTVDVLVKEDGTPFVLEVNSAAGLGGSMPRVWADTFIKAKENI